MPPFLALLLWISFSVWILSHDPAKHREVSPAVWIAWVWLVLIGSRSLSMWLGMTATSTAAALEEGNALDRTLYTLLMILAIAVLRSRSIDWRNAFAMNSALVALLLFGLLSVIWSDFPVTALKRWIRDLGSYLMVLVILSDPRPLEALSTLFRRTFYLLIPLSVLLIKYYRHIGVSYDPWTGTADFSGVTTSKNMLGALCLMSGLFFFWDTLRRWPDRRRRQTQRILLVNAAFIAMTLWLLNLADSATSRVCLVIACTVVVVVQGRWGRANPRRVNRLVPVAIIAAALLISLLNFSGSVAQLLGRDPTLSGRIEIWNELINADINPLLGAGYESFWLGNRLTNVGKSLGLNGVLNEAHNGYLETYLTVGLVGLGLLAGFLIAAYRLVHRHSLASVYFGSLGLALWSVLLIYNVTESAFKTHLVWFCFLLIAIAIPRARSRRRQRQHVPVTNAPRDVITSSMQSAMMRHDEFRQ
jgi:exopolysaccharide production protein ExoQ